MNFAQYVPFVVKALAQAASFEAGQAISIPIPAETLTFDLAAEGLGKVEITESGTTVSIKKA